jgi:hypothetical protein
VAAARRSQRPAASPSAARGDAEKRRREPGREGHEVEGARRRLGEARPGEPARIEGGRAREIGKSPDRRRGGENQPDRRAQEEQTEDARHRDGMEDTEEDEGLPHGEKGGKRDDKRRPCHHGEAAQEPPPADALPVREHEREANEKEEAARDGPREDRPAALERRPRRQVAEKLEVPGEVEDRHPKKRRRPGEVDRGDAAGASCPGGAHHAVPSPSSRL